MIHYIREVIFFPRLLVKHWELLWSFVHRELKARYEGSILGLLWPVIQPLVLFAVYYMVFAKLLKIPVSVDIMPWGDLTDYPGVFNTKDAGWRGTFFLVSGILPWLSVAEVLNRCTGVVLENANLIKKIAFPSEFLPIYVVVLQHIYFIIGCTIFLIIVWIVNGALPVLIAWIPLLIFLQMIFITGLGMLVGALNIFVRDTAQFVPLFTMFWMFISPVFYSPVVLIYAGNPKQKALVESIMPYLHINPMYNLLTMYREVFKYGRRTIPHFNEDGTFKSADVLMDQGINYNCLWIFAAQAVITFVVGYTFFVRSKGRFADEV